MECLIGIGSSIAGTIADYTVKAVGNEIGYFITYKRNVEDLKTKIKDLKLAKEMVDARNNCEIIEGDVQQWLNEANSISEKAAKLIPRDEDQANKCFSRGYFSGLIKQYKLSKEAKKTLEVIAPTVEQGKTLGKVSYRLSPSNSVKMEGYQEFETRAHVFEEIMEAVRDVKVRMIGVWGMGGVGKTMLVKAVASKAKSESLFTHVILTTVSRTPDFRRIQEEVAETLGLELKENTVALRAKRLQHWLSSKKKILIIIDDIWKKLDLEEVGLSFTKDQKECKILLTSRFHDVLCNEMDANKSFNLGVLSEFEATNLFDQIVGDLKKEHEFQTVKRKILQKCAGLPLAISVTAKSLKNKKKSFWEDAWKKLNMPNPANIEGVEKEVYSVIRWSYDFLRSDEAKSLLVLCSLHKEDEEISVETLLKYIMGLRFFHGIRKLKDARNRVFHLVETLKSSSLLLDGTEDNNVRMHDVIRNIILIIASRDRQMFFIRDVDELSERIKYNELEEPTAISLGSSSNMLPEIRLPCPKLQLFSLSQEYRSESKIPNQFFESTEHLQVLGLRNVYLSFPRFCCLSNLKTLICSEGSLENIAYIGEMKCLEILDLSGSDIKEVPKQLGNLTSLLSLNLSECRFLQVIEAGVVSSFKSLEELYIKGPSFTRWAPLTNVSGENCSNAGLEELKELMNITTLCLDIFDADNILPDDLVVDKLERFQIRVTSNKKNHTFSGKQRLSRSLILDQVNDRQLERSCLKQLISKAENLSINNVDIKISFFDESGEEGDLKVLTMNNVQIVGFSNMSAFRNLEELHLTCLDKLETIFNGCILSVETLANLRLVDVEACNSLKNLFPLSFSKGLKKLKVSCCEALENLFSNMDISDDVIEFPLLHSIELVRLPMLQEFVVGSPTIGIRDDDRLPLFHQKIPFPSLEKLALGALHSMKSLFPASVAKALLKLKSIRLEDCGQLQEIIAQEEGASDIVSAFVFPRLSSLYLRDLPELESLYRKLHCSEWPSLSELTLEGCGKVKILASQQSGNAPLFYMDMQKVAFPKLKKIDLYGLDHLEILCQSDQEFIPGSFGELERIKISHCDVLEKLFSHALMGNLRSLTELIIEDCAKIREVFKMQRPESVQAFTVAQMRDDEVAYVTGTVAFPTLTKLRLEKLDGLEMIWSDEDYELMSDDSFYNLEEIDIANCKKLTRVCSSTMLKRLQSLAHLNVKKCNMMKEVIEIRNTKTCERKLINSPISSLCLSNLPKLKHLLSYKEQCPRLGTSVTFKKLKQVIVSDCSSMINLFPTSVAKELFELESIYLCGCGQMREIIAEEEETEERVPKFAFPRLRILILSSLPELECLYRKLHCCELSSLSEFTLEECGKVKILASQLSNVSTISANSPLFIMDKVVFPRLKKMELISLCHLEMICQSDHEDQLISDSFGALETTSIRNCDALTKSSQISNMVSTVKNGVPVFVMLPLDSITAGHKLKHERAMEKSLLALKRAGVEGVMVDVWWGLVEGHRPGEYDWGGYDKLFEMAEKIGIKVQAAMSFHRFGGNVGDTVNIPLPKWVVVEMDRDKDIAYTDQWDHRNYEYVSLACDDLAVLKDRTPVQCYAEFMAAFRARFSRLLGKTIVEIQVGMGPAGELRYPSYPEGKKIWEFPGIGAFQCFDKNMRRSLQAAAEAIGRPEWGTSGPTDAGYYNIRQPELTTFFKSNCGGWECPYGEFFLTWYSQMLLDHCDRILTASTSIFDNTGVKVSVKITGVHWHYSTRSHAAELTAGYYNTCHRDGYLPIMHLLARHGAIINFTCMEMHDYDQRQDVQCSPEELVCQVVRTAQWEGVTQSGENALRLNIDAEFAQVLRRTWPVCAFTFLRMNSQLFDQKWRQFVFFVKKMRERGSDQKWEEVEREAEWLVQATSDLARDAAMGLRSTYLT